MKSIDTFKTKSDFSIGNKTYSYFSLVKLAKKLNFDLKKLPVSIKILLENLLRHEDGKRIHRDHIEALSSWLPDTDIKKEVPFMPARVLMQDFTGVPAITDLAAMRDAIARLGGDPALINPDISAHLVIDHSVQVDHFGTEDSFAFNSRKEFQRNKERYSFLKWGQESFSNFNVVPPATGICHQINLEYLAQVVMSITQEGETLAFPDTLVGLDSHTTMINGIGVVGWGVGGIEAEAVMLRQPYYMLIPQVIGFELMGRLPQGTTATDLVLFITQMMREKGVVGKFVEFFGNGLDSLSLPDRATIANMTPEFGATMSFFPVDGETLNYLRFTGRSDEQINLIEYYLKKQMMFLPDTSAIPGFTDTLQLDLSHVEPALAGPLRPQDRIPLKRVKQSFVDDLSTIYCKTGCSAVKDEMWEGEGGALVNPMKLNQKVIFREPSNEKGPRINRPYMSFTLDHGSVVIAAITSCTNTSNPSVLIGAGLIAKKAVESGLQVRPWVKTSLAPGSKVVIEYLEASGLLHYLKALRFHPVAFGCTTCIGNSGSLYSDVAKMVQETDLVVASVLSGNRNFEGRINPLTRANYLTSPMLVVAYALAGTVNIDMEKEPIGHDPNNEPVFLRDIWPTREEIQQSMNFLSPNMFEKQYCNVFEGNDNWKELTVKPSARYKWEKKSTYIKEPPFLQNMKLTIPDLEDIESARVLALLGDSITTDHISPAGAIPVNSPAGEYLIEKGVEEESFNSYGSRRGNHDVMMRGTFGNVRLRNRLVPDKEGGWTRHLPTGKTLSIYHAAMRYKDENIPLIVIAGKEYGTGSSRDWAAKGTLLLGVRAVIAKSFERIHRSNLVAMGVLPLQFEDGQDIESLGLSGEEAFDIEGISRGLSPNQMLTITAYKKERKHIKFRVKTRIDSAAEVGYYHHGGILPYVIRQMLD
ncbi:MAG: aconitate hydratase AcnA [Deltaproteobacteria bacterium]|jgi:aconitate hydratase|nr:aconitate hydratase AcnA [Deltaproteobacteria bacterium]